MHRGLAAARNMAIEAGIGKYIAYLDDDDWWMPYHLELLLQGLETTQFAYSDYWTTDEMGYIDCRQSLNYSYEQLLRQNLMPVNCVLHERTLFYECGMFDECLPSHDDYDMWLRFGKVTAFRHVEYPTCMISVRSDPERISMQTDRLADRTMIQARYIDA